MILSFFLHLPDGWCILLLCGSDFVMIEYEVVTQVMT